MDALLHMQNLFFIGWDSMRTQAHQNILSAMHTSDIDRNSAIAPHHWCLCFLGVTLSAETFGFFPPAISQS